MVRARMIRINKYNDLKEFRDLVLAVSFEDRSYLSLKRIIKTFEIERSYIIVFDDYFTEFERKLDRKDKKTIEKYRSGYEKVVKYLDEKSITYSEIRGRIFEMNGIITGLRNVKLKHPLLLDVSCIPRNYILSLLPEIELDNSLFVYSKVEKYSSKESDFVIGTRNVVSLPGFRGKIRNRDSILILILGFQGQRAMSLFRKYNPYRTLAFVPNPEDRSKKKNIDIVRENNKELLSNQYVRMKEIVCFNPMKFRLELEEKVKLFFEEEGIEPGDFNIVVSPFGPKPDILGLYKYWTNNKSIQISYSLPTRYRNNSTGIGKSYVVDYNDIP